MYASGLHPNRERYERERNKREGEREREMDYKILYVCTEQQKQYNDFWILFNEDFLMCHFLYKMTTFWASDWMKDTQICIEALKACSTCVCCNMAIKHFQQYKFRNDKGFRLYRRWLFFMSLVEIEWLTERRENNFIEELRSWK